MSDLSRNDDRHGKAHYLGTKDKNERTLAMLNNMVKSKKTTILKIQQLTVFEITYVQSSFPGENIYSLFLCKDQELWTEATPPCQS